MFEDQTKEKPTATASTDDADVAALHAATARRMEVAELPTGEPEPEPIDQKAELKGLFELAFRDGIGAMYPRVKARFTDEVIDNLAGGWAAVAKKYGWGSILGDFGPELLCVFVTVPTLIGTVQDIRADAADDQAADAAAAKA